MGALPKGPLAGVRVVDLSTEIAGPYATKLWVDAGADVIKLESPTGGDPLRRWTASGTPLPRDEDGALFRYLNASKRSVTADLASADGRAFALELTAGADFVVESAGPGEMQRLGLSTEILQAGNPALSMVSISPWGGGGPWARRPATEFTLQAATGSIAYRGLRDRDPVAAGGRLGEWIAGSFAAVGGLAAWLSAVNTGEGQHVDLSIFESMLLCMTIYHDLNGQFHEGPLPRAIETPSIEPARDGWVGFCTITGQQWKDFCAMIGRPELAEDERFYDATQRMDELAFIHGAIHAWTRERSVDEIVELASLLRIPVAPIGDGRNLPKMDHLAERGVYVENPHGFLQPRTPYLLGTTGPRPPGRAPRLGEHDEAVRAELADSDAADAPRAGRAALGDSALPLAGIRVLDLTAFWAGPMAAAFLADLGADVVKVESIQRPDGMRFAGAVRNEQMWEWSPVFHGANTGKRDVTLRLDSEEGMALLKRLIASADVVVENFSVRVLDNFGLGWETVHALNPRTILMRMPAFGLDGAWRDRTGFAMNIEQVSGMAWLTGYADLPLVVRGACDPIGGMHAVFALLLALHQRAQSGVRQLVEVPLVEPALAVAAEQVIEWGAYGQLLERDENRGPVAAPQGVYRSGDGETYVAVAVANDAQWRALCGVLGNEALEADSALRTAAGRRAAHDAIDEALRAWTGAREPDAAVEALLAAGVPASVLVNAHCVMPNPQLEHRAFFQELEHPAAGKRRYPGVPMRFSRLGTRLHPSPPPTLGQHNEEVLCGELGLSREELDELEKKQVLGTRPSFM